MRRTSRQGLGDHEYHPELPVSRDQMAAFIARAVCTPTGDAGLAGYQPPATPSFSDVVAGSWAYTYVEYCKTHGIVFGYADGSYQPSLPVTRDQMAVYVARAFNLVP